MPQKKTIILNFEMKALYQKLGYRERWATKRLADKMHRSSTDGMYSGTLYPSGFFTIGAIPRQKQRKDKTNADIPEYSRFEQRYLHSRVYDGDGNCQEESTTTYFYDTIKQQPTPPVRPLLERDLEAKEKSSVKRSDPLWVDGDEPERIMSLPTGERREDDTPSSLGLSSIPRCRKGKREGLKGITSYGKRMIHEGCHLLKEIVGVRRLGLYTLTCPYTEDELIKEFAKNWSEIVKRFLERVKRLYESQGVNFYYVGAIELQEKRYRQYGQVCPHMHYIAQCKDRTGKFIASAKQLRSIWSDVCSNAVGATPQVGASLDCVVVRKDPSAYLAKYLSKGGEIVSEIVEREPELLPKRWWTMSNNLRKSIKAFSLKLYKEKADIVWYICTQDEFNAKLEWRSKIYATLPSQGEVCIGFCGKVLPEMAFFLNPKAKNLALL